MNKVEPKIIIYDHPADLPMRWCRGVYDKKTQTIHILSQEASFKMTLNHEKEHHKRRNKITFKLSYPLGGMINILLYCSLCLILQYLFISWIITTQTFVILALLWAIPFLSWCYEEILADIAGYNV